MGMQEAVRACLNKYATINGRARRAEYWWFYLFVIIIQVVLMIVAGLLGAVLPPLATVAIVILGIVMLGLIIPGFCVTIRRMHDLDKSGWWVLIALVPAVGGLILLYFMVSRGTEGDNRFGPDPLAGEY